MATVAVRVDDKLKKEATELFNELGFDMSTAVKMFLIQSVQVRGLPFEVKEKSVITDEEFQRLVERFSKGKKVDFSNPKDVAEFFGDEDFSDYLDEV